MHLKSYLHPGIPAPVHAQALELALRSKVTWTAGTGSSGPRDGAEFDRGDVDICVSCGPSYLMARRLSGGTIAALPVAPKVAVGDQLFIGTYEALLVLRRSEAPRFTPASLAFGPWAVNDPLSLSGRLALDVYAQTQKLALSTPSFTGSHRASMAAVREGKARFATIDSVIYAATPASERDELAVVQRLGPFPLWPLIMRTEDPRRDDLTAKLLALEVPATSPISITGFIARPSGTLERELAVATAALESSRAGGQTLPQLE